MTRFDKNFNLILFSLLIFATIGVFWLQSKGLSAGTLYLSLILLGVAFISFIFFFNREEEKQFNFIIPINESNSRALMALLLGILFVLLINVVSFLTDSFSYTPKIMAPLASFGNSLLPIEQSFSALETAGSPAWTFFIIDFTAPIVEEWELGIVFPLVGIILSLLLRRGLKMDFSENGNKIFDFFISMCFSVIIFAILHMFNKTYANDTSLLLWAGAFRLVLNLIIYKYKSLGLMFGIGAHFMNNNIALGLGATISAFLDFPFGFVLMGFFALIFVMFIINREDIWNDFKELVGIT